VAEAATDARSAGAPTGEAVAVRFDGVTKRFGDVVAVDDVDLEVRPREFFSMLGPSGSGKTTCLRMIAGFEEPTSGRILLDGRDTREMGDRERANVRNRRIGFVFQAHNLLPEHTAVGNASIPVRLAGGSPAVANARAQALLEAVGLGRRLDHKPGELSGGEQQRVALARALVMAPGLVLADEPTGNLDPGTAAGVFELLLDLNAQLGSTLVVVTHSRELAERFPRRLSLEGGRFREW
jgi:lipoprotein-releasing system ATP-binding protein